MNADRDAQLIWAVKAATCIYLACDEAVAKDVATGIKNLAAAIRAMDAALEAAKEANVSAAGAATVLQTELEAALKAELAAAENSKHVRSASKRCGKWWSVRRICAWAKSRPTGNPQRAGR